MCRASAGPSHGQSPTSSVTAPPASTTRRGAPPEPPPRAGSSGTAAGSPGAGAVVDVNVGPPARVGGHKAVDGVTSKDFGRRAHWATTRRATIPLATAAGPASDVPSGRPAIVSAAPPIARPWTSVQYGQNRRTTAAWRMTNQNPAPAAAID